LRYCVATFDRSVASALVTSDSAAERFARCCVCDNQLARLSEMSALMPPLDESTSDVDPND
jgi:hypothetical protein